MGCLYFYCWILRARHIFQMLVLRQIGSLQNISSHSVACLFILLTDLPRANVFNYDEVDLKIYFSFVDQASGVIAKNSFTHPSPSSWSFSPMLALKSLIVLHFLFKSVVHFEFLFVKSMKFRLRFIFMPTDMAIGPFCVNFRNYP